MLDQEAPSALRMAARRELAHTWMSISSERGRNKKYEAAWSGHSTSENENQWWPRWQCHVTTGPTGLVVIIALAASGWPSELG